MAKSGRSTGGVDGSTPLPPSDVPGLAQDLGGSSAPPPPRDKRDLVVDALLRLAAVEPWDTIELPAIAREANLSLADLRDAFPSKGAILGGFNRRIDRAVLEGTGEDMIGEPTRERVLDVMMRRLDAMAAHKPALRNIRDALRRDPLSLAALNQTALNSWRYMLAAAGVDTEDELGFVKVQGAALVFARVMQTWLDEPTEDVARTMAVLDRELKRGEQVLNRADDVRRLTAPLRGLFRAAMERRTGRRREERGQDGDFYGRTPRGPAGAGDGDDYAPAL